MPATLRRFTRVPSFLRAERILILGTTPLADRIIREMDTRRRSSAVVGVLDDMAPASDHAAARRYLGPLAKIRTVVDDFHPTHIVVALAERRGKAPMRALLETYVSQRVVVEDALEFCERLTGKMPLESLTPMGVIASGRFRPAGLHQAIARGLSLTVALIALVALSPLLALIALAIKLDSSGPVLFAQKRVGAQGRPFTLLKFRTMRVGARRSEWELDNRDRVTRVGKWLRRFRLDELPQFVNILRGEMNLVGPRPHPVSNLELFTLVARNLTELTGAAIGCYALRLIVRPGITGWAQVRYRYANNLDEEIEKLRYDLYYVKHMSPWLDLRVLFETIRVLLRGRGAEETPATQAVAPAAVSHARPLGIGRKITARWRRDRVNVA